MKGEIKLKQIKPGVYVASGEVIQGHDTFKGEVTMGTPTKKVKDMGM